MQYYQDLAEYYCQPGMALPFYEAILRKNAKAGRNLLFLSNVCFMYLLNGQCNEALNLIAQMETAALRLKPEESLLMRVLICNNYCSVFLMMGKLPEASRYLQEAVQHLRNPAWHAAKSPGILADQLENSLTHKSYLYRVLAGDTEGAEPFFQTRLQVNASPCKTASDLYYLGLICQQQGRQKEATGYFQTLTGSYSNLWYAHAASQHLAAMGMPAS